VAGVASAKPYLYATCAAALHHDKQDTAVEAKPPDLDPSMGERKRTRSQRENKATNNTQRTGPQSIPTQVRQAVVARLEPEQCRYLGAGVVSGFDLTFKGPYLYIAARYTRVMGGPSRASPMCRLRYTGNADRWRLEMFRYRDHDYDTEQDFPNVSQSTPEECFGVAADFYLLESDPLHAGWSRNEPEELIPRHGKFEGRAMVLPPIRDARWPPVPGLSSDPPPVGDTPLVADFAAWMHWIRGRTVVLAPRTPIPMKTMKTSPKDRSPAASVRPLVTFWAMSYPGLRCSCSLHPSRPPPLGSAR
jgi:hypothetical protein